MGGSQPWVWKRMDDGHELTWDVYNAKTLKEYLTVFSPGGASGR